jgi:hypothetical protein
MTSGKFRGKPRALSEYEGRIATILLVNGGTFTDSHSDERIFEDPEFLVKALCSCRDQEELLHFVILAELDRDIETLGRKSNSLNIKPSLESIWSSLQANSNEKIFNTDIRGDVQERYKFSYEVIREDIAIERIVSETIRHAINDPDGKCSPVDVFELSGYVRDRVVVLGRSSDEVSLLKSFYIWPNSNKNPAQENFVSRYIADILSASRPYINVRHSPIFMEGGDLLVGKNFALVGHRTLKENISSHSRNPNLDTAEKILGRFAEALGVESVYCPTYFNPPKGFDNVPPALYHLDLYLTFLGERAEMLLVALGEIMVWDGCAWERAPNDDPEQAFLDHYEWLLEQGLPNGQRFIIKRLPLLRNENVLFSYNNCLVESYQGKPRVFLPTFEKGAKEGLGDAFKEADVKTIEMLDQWGIITIPVRYSFQYYAMSRAGLRCLTQVLRRTTD